MSTQSENNSYPFGGHFRVEVSADGTAGASRVFTRSCLTMSGHGADKSAAMFITHLLDPVPTEIHVFTALTAHQPVGVGTMDKRLWWVTGEAIEVRKLD